MGRPKAGIILSNGLTMIEHVYHALSQVCTNVVLVGHFQGVPSSLAHVLQIKDNLEGRGPLGGLEALLGSGLDSEYLISPCDLGLVNNKVFELLIRDQVIPPVILAHPEYDLNNMRGQALTNLIDQPLIGRYSASMLPLVRRQIDRNELAMHRFIQLFAVTRVIIPKYLRKATTDADTPHDLNRLFCPN